MYIAQIHIQNYRCFRDIKVEFREGINVVIGESNAGKTALLRALGLIFDRRRRRRPDIYDFHQGTDHFDQPPIIAISVTLRSSPKDTLADMALVASWLTKLDAPWEAMLTYRFALPEEDAEEFRKEPLPTDRDAFLRKVERYLPKYVSNIYGGKPEAFLKAEPESLSKFDFQFLDAIRDVEAELFTGQNPLLRAMLTSVLDHDISHNLHALSDEERQKRQKERTQRQANFDKLSGDLKDHLLERLSIDALFNLVEETGARDGGEPNVSGHLTDNDLIAALRLVINRGTLSFPADHNGLGYNNLVYISLVLASIDFEADTKKFGSNAILFPMLVIEEPEAHLHPALQYKLLKYIQKRLSEAQRSRQVFITSHSTHITAASGLDPLICLTAPDDKAEISIAYPSRVFGNSPAEMKSKRYVERYLDATKSNMLFAKGVIFVEGIAELLLIPCLAECMSLPLETHHVAVVAVGGVTFKHFLPIFGAGSSKELRQFALRRSVACIIDPDPARQEKVGEAKRKKCWPYQLGCDSSGYEYWPISATAQNLLEQCAEASNIQIYYGTKTLEYDLALDNHKATVIITPTCTHKADLLQLAEASANLPLRLRQKLEQESSSLISDIETITDLETRRRAQFATCYLLCTEEFKGEHAFDLALQLRENHAKPDYERVTFQVPIHIGDAIRWACNPSGGTPAS